MLALAVVGLVGQTQMGRFLRPLTPGSVGTGKRRCGIRGVAASALTVFCWSLLFGVGGFHGRRLNTCLMPGGGDDMRKAANTSVLGNFQRQPLEMSNCDIKRSVIGTPIQDAHLDILRPATDWARETGPNPRTGLIHRPMTEPQGLFSNESIETDTRLLKQRFHDFWLYRSQSKPTFLVRNDQKQV